MCGLAGMLSSTFNKDFINIALDLGMVSQLRGLDSAGMFMMNTTTGDNKTVKTLGLFTNLYTKKLFKESLNEVKPNLLMIHTRAATLGSVDMANCQPIERSGVVGCHNGTILGLNKGSVSDSNVLYSEINTNNCHLPDVYNKTVGKGAAALVWTDLVDNTLNILRNNKRTLSFSYNKAKTVMFYMSEDKMLDTMLDRTSYFFDKAVSVEAGKHAMFDLDNLTVSVTDVGSVTNFKDLYKTKVSQQVKTTDLVEAKQDTGTDVIVVPDSDAHVYRGARGALHTRREGIATLKAGCCNCNAVPDISTEVKYIGNSTEYICEDCYDNSVVLEYVGPQEQHTSKLYIK